MTTRLHARWGLAFFLLLMPLSSPALTMRELVQGPPPAEIAYKSVGGETLKLYTFLPARDGDAAASGKVPAVIWIHGGAWIGGTTDGFMPHARYCAARGMAAFNITYRLARPEGPSVAECVADCKSAVRYVRAHAAEWGVDPHRIAVAGDSAGGHLAAALGTIEALDDAADDRNISARPDAMILFNPIVDMSEGAWLRFAVGGEALAHPKKLPERSPENLARAESLSPLAHVRPGLPPALLMHGLADKVVTPEQARRFANAMKEAGNRCDLVLLENIGHAFIVAGYKSPESVVVEALRAADRFLASLGYVQGEPTVTVSEGEPAWVPLPASYSPPPVHSPQAK